MKLEQWKNANGAVLGIQVYADNETEHDLLESLAKVEPRFVQSQNLSREKGWGNLTLILQIPHWMWSEAGSSSRRRALDANSGSLTGENGSPATISGAPSKGWRKKK
jgi:hypothetical protein